MTLFLDITYPYENLSHRDKQESFNLDFLRLAANDTVSWLELSLWKSFTERQTRKFQLRFFKMGCYWHFFLTLPIAMKIFHTATNRRPSTQTFEDCLLMTLFLDLIYRSENLSQSRKQETFNLDFLTLSANDTVSWLELSLWKSLRQRQKGEVQLRFFKIVW